MTKKQRIVDLANGESRSAAEPVGNVPAEFAGRASFLKGTPLKLSDVCERLGVSEREALYALTLQATSFQDAERPGSGNHRSFVPLEALSLAVALELKAAGMKAPRAVQIAAWLVRTFPAKSSSSTAAWWGPDWRQFAQRRLSIEVAQARKVRLCQELPVGTDGTGDCGPWVNVSDGSRDLGERPCTVVRVSISDLAARLQKLPETP